MWSCSVLKQQQLWTIWENTELISIRLPSILWSAVQIHQPGSLCVILTLCLRTDVITCREGQVFYSLWKTMLNFNVFSTFLSSLSPCCRACIMWIMKQQASTAVYMELVTFPGCVNHFLPLEGGFFFLYVSKGKDNLLHTLAYPFGWDLHCCDWSRNLDGENNLEWALCW